MEFGACMIHLICCCMQFVDYTVSGAAARRGDGELVNNRKWYYFMEMRIQTTVDIVIVIVL